MKSLRVRVTEFVDPEDDENFDLTWGTAFLDVDKMSSLYIEKPDIVDGQPVKCYGIVCEGRYYSVMVEPHVYEVVYERFIKNSIKE